MAPSKKRTTKSTTKRARSRSHKAVKPTLRSVKFLHYRRHLMSFVVCFVALVGFAAYAITRPVPPPEDDRPSRIDAYFSKYNMPLAGYGNDFVAIADECEMDWRLLPAIAVRESTGGKHMQYNNPFGWGGAKIPFKSIPDAIQTVGMNLCGDNPRTARLYSNTPVRKKLYYYNGTVVPSYPSEVMWIMKQF